MRLRRGLLAACLAALMTTFQSGVYASIGIDPIEQDFAASPLASPPFNIPERAIASLTFKDRWNDEFASLGRPAAPFRFEFPDLREPLREADPWSLQKQSEPQAAPERSDVPLPRARPNAGVEIGELPPEFRGHASRIAFGASVLAPFAHARFCLKNPDDCRTEGDGETVALTAARAEELSAVNRQVNRAIRPQHMEETPVNEKWEIAPAVGDCNDYAVTKRHELLARGWPSAALLLAEVITNWGEHHLVLVVRTSRGDYVADNLAPRIRRWSDTDYVWVRMQLPRNPNLWAKVRGVPSA